MTVVHLTDFSQRSTSNTPLICLRRTGGAIDVYSSTDRSKHQH